MNNVIIDIRAQLLMSEYEKMLAHLQEKLNLSKKGEPLFTILGNSFFLSNPDEHNEDKIKEEIQKSGIDSRALQNMEIKLYASI